MVNQNTPFRKTFSFSINSSSNANIYVKKIAYGGINFCVTSQKCFKL